MQAGLRLRSIYALLCCVSSPSLSQSESLPEEFIPGSLSPGAGYSILSTDLWPVHGCGIAFMVLVLITRIEWHNWKQRTEWQET